MALVTLPLFLTDSSEIVNMDEAMDEDESFLAIYGNSDTSSLDACKKRTSDVLEDCIQLGQL